MIAQLELSLDDVRVNVPWVGKSPRALTRAALSPIFKAQAAKGRPIPMDPRQIDFWLPGKKAPWIYQGAPLLKEV